MCEFRTPTLPQEFEPVFLWSRMSAVGAERANIPQTGKIYLRVKYQGWPVDKAIAEMRQYGHV